MKTVKILVVDDSEVMRHLMATLLRSAGHEVLEAADGEQAAIAAETSGKLGAVVTDVCMPHLNGFSLAAKLRVRDSQLPFVFVSGFPIDHSLAGNNARLLIKPFQLEDLLAAVTSIGASRH